MKVEKEDVTCLLFSSMDFGSVLNFISKCWTNLCKVTWFIWLKKVRLKQFNKLSGTYYLCKLWEHSEGIRMKSPLPCIIPPQTWRFHMDEYLPPTCMSKRIQDALIYSNLAYSSLQACTVFLLWFPELLDFFFCSRWEILEKLETAFSRLSTHCLWSFKWLHWINFSFPFWFDVLINHRLNILILQQRLRMCFFSGCFHLGEDTYNVDASHASFGL